MSIICNRKNDRLTGAIEGTPFNIIYTDELFADLKTISARLGQSKSKEVYNSIVSEAEKLVDVDFGVEVAAANGYLMFNVNKGTYHLVSNKGTNKEVISEDPIPQSLADRIVETHEEGGDFMPLLMAWRRFITREGRKPKDTALFANYITSMFVDKEAKLKHLENGMTEEAATELATFNDLAVTTFGMLATYKVVERVKKIYKLTKGEDGKTVKKLVDAFPSKEEIDEVTGEITKTEGQPKFLEEITFKPAIYTIGDKFFCGEKLAYMYKIGKEAVLPEDAKRNHNNTFGGGGLYAGGLGYIDTYKHDDREVLTCFIDPSEIISFQDEGQAFRTNRMFINGAMDIEGDTQGMYFVSDYSKESDLRIKERFEKAIVEANEAKAKAEKKAHEASANATDVVGNGE